MSWAEAQVRENAGCACPWCWGSVGLSIQVMCSYPLKPGGASSSVLIMGSQVCLTRFLVGSSLLILVAMILSSVSLLLMLWSHLRSISWSECSVRWITRSHLITHIRCADSDIRILKSLFFPARFCLRARSASWSFVFAGSGMERFPHPRIVPMSIWGHSFSLCGHRDLARGHIRCVGLARHSSRMWFMSSVAGQDGHLARCSWSGMFSQSHVFFISLPHVTCDVRGGAS